MTKEEFIDKMTDCSLSKVRGDRPQLEEIAACKYYTEIACEKFWSEYSPAIMIKETVLDSQSK